MVDYKHNEFLGIIFAIQCIIFIVLTFHIFLPKSYRKRGDRSAMVILSLMTIGVFLYSYIAKSGVSLYAFILIASFGICIKLDNATQ